MKIQSPPFGTRLQSPPPLDEVKVSLPPLVYEVSRDAIEKKRDSLSWGALAMDFALLGSTVLTGYSPPVNQVLVVESPVSDHLNGPIDLARSKPDIIFDKGSNLVSPQAFDGETFADQIKNIGFETVRSTLKSTVFPPLDPYVATILSAAWANQNAVHADSTMLVTLPEHFDDDFSVSVNLDQGPNKPMLLILPGIGADSSTGYTGVLKRMAMEQGMNYTVVANPWSSTWTDSGPVRNPGNLAAESETVSDILTGLQEQKPGYFENITVAGYSYGSTLGAGLVRDQIRSDGNSSIRALVAISPPQDMLHSMDALDSLRDQYESGADWTDVAFEYNELAKNLKFDDLAANPSLLKRSEVDTEMFLADVLGVRRAVSEATEKLDTVRGYNLLPLNREISENGPIDDLDRELDLEIEQETALDELTLRSYRDTYLLRDPWFAENGTTPDKVSSDYRFSEMLRELALVKMPVFTVSSRDDYILQPEDVDDLRQSESRAQGPQITEIFESGGHVGLLYHPQIRDSIGSFLTNSQDKSS